MRRYLIFVTAALGLLMSSIDTTVVAVAVPNFMKDLGTNVIWAGWTMSIYLLAVTTVMPLAGNLSDTFGRKRVFLISLILFTGSSLACGLAPNIYSLVAFRFLQGIGGACFLPTAAGIVSDQFPENRERAIGLFTSIFAYWKERIEIRPSLLNSSSLKIFRPCNILSSDTQNESER
jgi:MFS family permease